MGLLERWGAQNQEALERQNREGIERWATATTEWKLPWWHLAIPSLFFLRGLSGMMYGIVEGSIGRVVFSAVSVIVWGLALAMWYFMRSHRR